MKEFLIVKTSSIGDVIQCFHLIEYLKSRFPKCRIDWVAEKSVAPLLRSHPHLDQIIEIDTKTWRKNLLKNRSSIKSFRKELRGKLYDEVFDLQGNSKSAIVTAFAKSRRKVGFSWGSLPEKPNFFVTNVHLPCNKGQSVRERYSQLLQDYFGDDEPLLQQPLELTLNDKEKGYLQHLSQLGFSRPRLMICFGSNWINKRLKEQTLVEFLHLINETLAPTFFFIWGSEKEKEMADRLEREFSGNSHTVGDMSLPLWQRFMSIVEGVIAMDSAALHLCATTKTPSFSLFGPSSAQNYKPLGDMHHAFQGICPYNEQFEKRCSKLRTCKTGACLREVGAKQLYEHFQSFWNSVSKSMFASTS